nr:prolyl oligopeptidase family serine peptidase [uncultured Carboxylicivirga sp.]
MKKISFFYLFAIISTLVSAQTKVECNKWKASEVIQLYKPIFSDQNSVDNKAFKTSELLKNIQSAEAIQFNNWDEITISEDSIIKPVNNTNQAIWLEGFISSDRYTKATLEITSNGIYELYLEGKKIKTQESASVKEVKTELTLSTGNHCLQVKLLCLENQLKYKATINTKEDSENQLSWSTNNQRGLTINDILDGKSIQRFSISPSGKYLIINESEVLTGSGKRISSMQILDIIKNKAIHTYPEGGLSGAQWLPQSDKISYTIKKGNLSDIHVLDVVTGEDKLVAEKIDDLGYINWSPNEEYVIFSRSMQADKPGDLKRVFGNDDRLPYFRSLSFLYKLDINNGTVQQLTAGFLSTSLHDIKPDGSKILFSTRNMDYTVVPFSKQTLFEMDITTFELDTIWKDKLYGGSCQYSPDGTQLLVSGSPETFGELGFDVNNDHLPNSYDGQLYIYDLKTQQAEAITKKFDPSTGTAIWKSNNEIYLTASDKDLVKLYKYDLKTKAFKAFSLPVEVVSRIDIAKKSLMAAFNGTSISTADKLYTINLKNGESKLVSFPKEKELSEVAFGNTERWDFVNKNGTNIIGSIYYPKNYDPSKKYPLIVYYYGGTSPTSRSFGGRYPKNIWAANGYMVYVLQPSGATGFGQSFSALHVNGWGTDAIDDIIDGTKQFLTAHPTADAENVGCIGASYGGFTTMMLQTRTDIFKTAIAHAGISDISSYWGEGYWGYSYSAGATKNSYPWNRRDIYVDNSPLFNADKFQNTILLLHGTSDTNVPVGESLQFYAALKILNKDVEMVLIDGEDHHILDYSKRIKWHNTIIAWFDKMLKDQPEQFNEMYPDKNL